MKKIKIVLIFSALMCCLLALTACGSSIARPTGLRIDQDSLELSWNASEQADRYILEINGTELNERVASNS